MNALPSPERMSTIVSGVTETLLGLTFLPDAEAAPWTELVSRGAVMQIRGERPLTVGLSSNDAGCTALSAAMFDVAAATVNDEMRADALCELVNMTAGLLKSHLQLDQALGLPRLVPRGEPPVPSQHLPGGAVVLRAQQVGLVLWIFEGLA